RAGVSKADPLQQGGEGRPLRRMGTAATLLRGASRGLQIAALTCANNRSESVLANQWLISRGSVATAACCRSACALECQWITRPPAACSQVLRTLLRSRSAPERYCGTDTKLYRSVV